MGKNVEYVGFIKNTEEKIYSKEEAISIEWLEAFKHREFKYDARSRWAIDYVIENWRQENDR